MTDKIQRSYYVTEKEARWLKIRAAEMGVTVSEILRTMIQREMEEAADQKDVETGWVAPHRRAR